MNKLMFATAIAAVGLSSAFADVYNVKFSAKTPVDVANTKGEVTTSLKTVTVQGLWDMDQDKYVFWTVNGSVYTPIKNATLALVAQGDFLKKDELIKTQVAEEWELLWGEEGWGDDVTKLEGAFVASGLKRLTVNRNTGDIVPTSMNGNFAGQMFGKPAYGTWSISKNTTATKNGIDAALPKKLTDREFGAAKEEELQAWKDALNSSDENLTAAQEEIKKLNADMAALADELDAANVTIDVKAEEIKGLQDSLAAAGAAYEALEGALAETNGVLAEAQANLEAANKSIEALEQTLTDTESTLAEKVEALNTADSKLKQALEDLTALQNEKNALQTRYDQLREEFVKRDNELSATREELDRTKADLNATQDELAAAEAAVAKAEAKLAEVSGVLASVEKELGDTKGALAEAEEALKQCGEKNKELQGKFDVLKLTYDTIVAAVKELDDVDSAKLISSFIAEQKKIMEEQKASALAKKAQLEKDYLTYDQIITEVNDKEKSLEDAQKDEAAKKAAYEAAKAAYDDKLVEVEILRALSNGLYRSGWYKERVKIIEKNEENIANAQTDINTLIAGLEGDVDDAQEAYDKAYNRFYGNDNVQAAGQKVQDCMDALKAAKAALEAFNPDSITVDTETFEEYIERTGADPEDAQTVLDWQADYAKRLSTAQDEARAALQADVDDAQKELDSAMNVHAYKNLFVPRKAELDAATADLQDAEAALEEAKRRAEEGGDVAELIAGYQALIDQAKAEIKRAEETVWSLEIQKAEEANLVELEKAMNDAKAAWDAAIAAVDAAETALKEIISTYSTGKYGEDGAFGKPLAGVNGEAYTAARAEAIQQWQDIADNAQAKVDALEALTEAVFPAE